MLSGSRKEPRRYAEMSIAPFSGRVRDESFLLQFKWPISDGKLVRIRAKY